jgi:hypothetical protein
MQQTTGGVVAVRKKKKSKKKAGGAAPTARQAALEMRKASIEAAAEAVDFDSPGWRAFSALWGDRYKGANLARLFVQCPGATPRLHKYETWLGMGRQVRQGVGVKAILLRIPRTHNDPDKITERNPDGEVFTGAPWMALFDISQTEEIDGFTDSAPESAGPELVDEVRRLRQEAIALHPEADGGDAEKFKVAWAAYEAAKTLLKETAAAQPGELTA